MLKTLTLLTVFGLLLVVSPSVFAQTEQQIRSDNLDYQPIVGLPFLDTSQADDPITFIQFIQILYALAIGIAGLLAVVKIIYAGVQYMLTDVITSKEKAKKDIWGAILGLVIVLAAVFILEQINPQLNEFTLLRNAVEISGPDLPQSVGIQSTNGGAEQQTDLQKFVEDCRERGGTAVPAVDSSGLGEILWDCRI